MNEFDNGRCGAKESSNLGSFHIRPKAHVDEEEMSEDERRRSEMPGDVAEDNPVLGKPRSRKEKAAHHQRAVSQSVLRESIGATRQPWENSGRAILG